MVKFKKAAVVIIALALFGCSDEQKEIEGTEEIDPQNIYFDYKVSGEEGSEYVTIKLQYRNGGEMGNSLRLDEPSAVTLDGENIPPDSSRMQGSFYEIAAPLEGFEGRHVISFTDIKGRKFNESFNFQPFRMVNELPAYMVRGDWVFEFEGLEPLDLVQVIVIDTSFTSGDINEQDTVKDGRLIISGDRLASLVDGPVQLEFYKEVYRPVRDGTEQGGKMVVSYGLKRTFDLVTDSTRQRPVLQ